MRERIGHVDDGGDEVFQTLVGLDVRPAPVVQREAREGDVRRRDQGHRPAGMTIHRRHREQARQQAEGLQRLPAAPNQRQGRDHATEAAIMDEPAVEPMLGRRDPGRERGDRARGGARAHRAQAGAAGRVQRRAAANRVEKHFAQPVDDQEHDQRTLARRNIGCSPSGLAIVQPVAQPGREAIEAAVAIVGQHGTGWEGEAGIEGQGMRCARLVDRRRESEPTPPGVVRQTAGSGAESERTETSA